MNKINSTFCNAGVLSPASSPSITSSVKSDTNMGTKGSFLYRIPSPLVSSQLVHMVGVDTRTFFNLPHPFLQTILFNYLYKPSQHRSQQTGGCVHT